MKFISTTLIVAACFAFVSAQQNPPIIAITSPLMGTKYKAGQQAILAWVNPKVPSISQIVLARGPSTGLQPITVLASNVNTADGKYVWKIPDDIEGGDDYAFECGTSPDIAFAGPFTIEGNGSAAPASNSSSTPAAAPPKAASPAAAAAAPAAAAASKAPAAAPASSGSAPAGGIPIPAGSGATPAAGAASASKAGFPVPSAQAVKASSASTTELLTGKTVLAIGAVALIVQAL
ncbi:hypothetical protein CLU79DRAFT_804467 [Phycomyces nitens]|nr:hypothetical protein CLU79DRAFT_804467 [Phycomyces nitens]